MNTTLQTETSGFIRWKGFFFLSSNGADHWSWQAVEPVESVQSIRTDLNITCSNVLYLCNLARCERGWIIMRKHSLWRTAQSRHFHHSSVYICGCFSFRLWLNITQLRFCVLCSAVSVSIFNSFLTDVCLQRWFFSSYTLHQTFQVFICLSVFLFFLLFVRQNVLFCWWLLTQGLCSRSIFRFINIMCCK